MIQPAKPKSREGRILLPDQSAAQPWFGRVIRANPGCGVLEGDLAFYDRTFPMRPIKMALEDGTWEPRDDLIILHKQALRGWWTVTDEQATRLMEPDAEPLDPKLERELEKIREAKV